MTQMTRCPLTLFCQRISDLPSPLKSAFTGKIISKARKFGFPPTAPKSVRFSSIVWLVDLPGGRIGYVEIPNTIGVLAVPFGSKCQPVRIDEARCKRYYPPVWIDLGNPAGVGSDKNVTPRVHCHISAAIARIDIGPRPVRGYFEHGGSIGNVTVDCVETDPQRTSNTRNGSRLGPTRQRKARHDIATILCDKEVRSVDGEADWIVITPEAKVVRLLPLANP